MQIEQKVNWTDSQLIQDYILTVSKPQRSPKLMWKQTEFYSFKDKWTLLAADKKECLFSPHADSNPILRTHTRLQTDPGSMKLLSDADTPESCCISLWFHKRQNILPRLCKSKTCKSDCKPASCILLCCSLLFHWYLFYLKLPSL